MVGVAGVVLFISEKMLIRTKTGNKHYHPKIKGIKPGDKVWLYFTNKGVLLKVEKMEDQPIINPPRNKMETPTEYDESDFINY